MTDLERSPLAPGEGTWAVFAMKVVRERDEARNEVEMLRAEVERLRWGNEMGCENTPNPACRCSGCETARERADRGETGP